MRQHGAKPPYTLSLLPKGRVGGRSTVSPQHADLAHTSAARRGQGHAQKTYSFINLAINR
ncbi:MAG: hypothetical protein NZ455_01615 [Bacteroidia bacterium]|nr:hypothetical protein [Bacteroidia bacterium]